jgi:hypothetical protein
MRCHSLHQIANPLSPPRGVYDPGGLEIKEKIMTDHPLEERYRHGYTWKRCEGEVTLALFGGQPRTYSDTGILTRTADHPDPETAPPAVVVARNAYGIAVVELFDLPDTGGSAVVDLAAERDRRRSNQVSEGA